MPRRNRKMRGGFGEDLWGSITNAYQSAKEKVMGTSTGSTYTPAAPVYTPPPAPPAPIVTVKLAPILKAVSVLNPPAPAPP